MTESLLQSEANQTLETHKKNQAGNIAIANVLNGGSYSCFERLFQKFRFLKKKSKSKSKIYWKLI